MLNDTCKSAIRLMVYLALRESEEPVPPRRIAERLDCSPTYLAKITSVLVKAGLLASQRGARGGVSLQRSPGSITLQEIVEASQGKILGDFCREAESVHSDLVCAFHRAMQEIHEGIVGTLSRWTLADLVAKPAPSAQMPDRNRCEMAGLDCLLEERKA